ncbi:hypothetical protein BC826DRAFT_974560 [Russula brevipes]|nr:hypothetical protein BC826DRAFT_974560 [Russula brevipes]
MSNVAFPPYIANYFLGPQLGSGVSVSTGYTGKWEERDGPEERLLHRDSTDLTPGVYALARRVAPGRATGNCVVGLEPRRETIYMIDFGFAKRYLDHKQKHIANRAERSFIGNYWFSSVNVHCRGKSTTPPASHTHTGCLAWTRNGVPRDEAAHDRLKREKRAASAADLGRGLPAEFEEFLRYCRSLAFAEQPDYALWRRRFCDLADELGYKDATGSSGHRPRHLW